MQADHLLLVQTTFEQRIHAEELSVDLIEKHLAACVQISGPVSSVYRWKGELQHEEEYILTAKTFGEYYEKVAACIEKNHPYEVPEIIAIPVTSCSDAYLKWFKEQCTG